MAARKGMRRCGVEIALAGLVLCSRLGPAQSTPTLNKVQLFQTYFDALAAEPHTPQRGAARWPAQEQLVQMIPTMTTSELQRAVSIIDAAIDQARISHDGIARIAAGMLLWYISGTKDGPALMALDISRLSALCSDPFTLGGSFTMLVTLQRQYSELSVPTMLQAIKAPDTNSPAGKGPAYATILFMYPRDGDLVKDVLVYMKRPDLTGQKLLDFLTGIYANRFMPDAVVEQLFHYLDAPQADVRLAALRDISGAGFDERKRLKPTFQRLADDPTQSAAFHKLAVELLDANEMFWLDYYQ